MSTSCTETPASTPRSCAPAETVTLPVPGATLQCAGVSSTDHAPPWSAEPQPLLTLRLNVSSATQLFGGGPAPVVEVVELVLVGLVVLVVELVVVVELVLVVELVVVVELVLVVELV